jgi:hypothetical protein
MINSALDSPTDVTYYAADPETADYLCNEQFGRDYGVWTQVAKPSDAGWSPYHNLAISSFSNGFLCTHGSTCYDIGARHGRELYCYDLDFSGMPVRDIVPANKFGS